MSDPKKDLQRLEALRTEQSSWRAHWKELSDHIQPWRGRFLLSDANDGKKRHDAIIHHAPVTAARILNAGMMSGITSPARPWYRLTTADPDLAEVGSVREWLFLVEQRIREALAKSNLYNCLHGVYADLSTFGTAVLYVEDDEEDGIRGYVFPVGQFYLANSPRLRVDTVYREFRMTVGQVVEAFGIENVSSAVKLQFEQGQVDAWVDIVHVIGPNKKRGESGRGYAQNMPFRSCWFEKNIEVEKENRYLRERGFEEFPCMAPRWDVAGEDVYGSSPGMTALADCKGLQQLATRCLELVDLSARPPMRGPAHLRRGSLVPGDITQVSLRPGEQTFEPAMRVEPQAIREVREALSASVEAVYSAFYADLWRALLDTDRRQMTAREVAERAEEKMIQLGPVMERLQDELLDPLIDRVFGILLRRGDIPRPPPELEGKDLRVEYLSIMAQAQKLLSTTGIERTAEFALALANADQTALDKLNVDEMIDSFAEAVGSNPKLVRSDEDVARIRQQRAQAAQAQQQAEVAAQGAKAARDLSGASLENDNALRRLVDGLGPVAAANGGLPQ